MSEEVAEYGDAEGMRLRRCEARVEELGSKYRAAAADLERRRARYRARQEERRLSRARVKLREYEDGELRQLAAEGCGPREAAEELGERVRVNSSATNPYTWTAPLLVVTPKSSPPKPGITNISPALNGIVTAAQRANLTTTQKLESWINPQLKMPIDLVKLAHADEDHNRNHEPKERPNQ